MKKIANRLLFTLVLFPFAVTAAELKDCSELQSTHPEKAKKYLMCLDGNINRLERERQTWINKLVLDTKKYQEDTGNTQILPIMKRAFSHQEGYMEDSCRWRYLLSMPNATRSAIAYKNCKVKLLQAHIDELSTATVLGSSL